MAELIAQIRLALPYLADDIEDDEASSQLQQHGFPQELADKCVCFIPLAFGRFVLHSAGAKTSDTYCLMHGESQPKCGLLLVHEPVYQAALAVGQHDVDSGKWDKNLHQLIATRSAEIQACNQLLLDNPAAKITDIVFTESYMILGKDLTSRARKPWWRFW